MTHSIRDRALVVRRLVEAAKAQRNELPTAELKGKLVGDRLRGVQDEEAARSLGEAPRASHLRRRLRPHS
jgi:hypothetical protein